MPGMGRRRVPGGDPLLGGGGGSRFDERERILLAETMKAIVREYLPRTANKSTIARRRRAEARRWIYDDSDASLGYAFGFLFICTYLGLDPARVRRRIEWLAKGKNRELLYSRTEFKVYPPGPKPGKKSIVEEE